VINMAHGDMLMLGAYTAYVVEDPQALPILVRNVGQIFGQEWQTDFGLNLSLYWAIPIAFLVVGVVGYVIEVCLIRFLYGRPLDTLLATWGVGLMLQQGIKVLFGPDLKPLSIPPALKSSLDVAGFTFPIYRMFVVGIAIICLLLVYLW